MRQSILYLVIGLSSMFGATVAAQEPADSNPRFRAADADSNGTLSREEFKTYVSEKLPGFRQFNPLMKRLDQNNDQQLSPEEFENRRQETEALMATAPVEFADGFNIRYARESPRVGDSLGELVAFDEDGNELDFETLKGKYTVFNFGCLT